MLTNNVVKDIAEFVDETHSKVKGFTIRKVRVFLYDKHEGIVILRLLSGNLSREWVYHRRQKDKPKGHMHLIESMRLKKISLDFISTAKIW